MARPGLALTALLHLAALRVLLLALPMPWISVLLRLNEAQAENAPTVPRAGAAEEVAWAVGAAAARAPIFSTCLTDALAGHLLLRRRGVASLVHLGAARDDRGRPQFHAWLSVDGRPVIGGRDATYQELAAIR